MYVSASPQPWPDDAQRTTIAENDAPRGVLRADIQGLRAVAVGVVLLYHLWPNRVPGGFVGVDVFFVISGFLIGGHLLGEVRETGRVRLGRFWVRRAKRLLPASLLVLLVVTVATLLVAPLSTRSGFLDEVVGSVLYMQNWVLADKAVDYLALGDAASPVQHYWSLSVEEQLYVALPLLLFVLTLRSAGGARRLRLPVAVLAGLAVASLVWSVVSTRTDAGIAYFSTATRAWEFLAGALLACVASRPAAGVRVVMSVAGVAAVAGRTGAASADEAVRPTRLVGRYAAAAQLGRRARARPRPTPDTLRLVTCVESGNGSAPRVAVPGMNTTAPRLIDDLNALHDRYVAAINAAVATGDQQLVDELAAGYDTEATWMVAEREGKTHLLPLKRRAA